MPDNPMNAEAMAKKIHSELHGAHTHPMQEKCLEFIAAQITEAKREAVEKVQERVNLFTKELISRYRSEGFRAAQKECLEIHEHEPKKWQDLGFNFGWSAARKKAAGIAIQYDEYAAERILAMEPDNE